MREFIKGKGLLIGIIAVVISAVTLASAYFASDKSSVFANTVGVVMHPVEKGIASAVGLLEDLYGYMYNYDLIAEENEALKEENARLAEMEREAEAAIAENAQLREQLELKERTLTYDTENATVTSWTASNWGSSFTISKGSSNNIEVDDPVIDSAGNLVGQVTEVGTTWATVSTVYDTSTNLGATAGGDVSAMAVGDFNLMKQGQLRLSYVPSDSSLVIGDTVLTSGAGEVFPQGLVIGKITDVQKEQSGATDYAVIEPAADFGSLNLVFVIKEFEFIE